MISGLNSANLASAIRTASRARETMDTMSRQIATGQRVASVKDDGAAWARANGLRGEAKLSETKASMVSEVIGRNQVPIATATEAAAAASRLKEILLRAIDGVNSSPATRQALANEWTEAVLAADVSQKAAYPLMSTDGVFWSNDQTDSFGTWHLPFNGIADMQDMRLRRAGWDFAAAYSSWASSIQSGTAATLIGLLGSMEAGRSAYERAAVGAGIENDRMERRREMFDAGASRLTAAAASLTDADLGKASTTMRQAETRQQLALNTVRQAISTYGNFAGGLLGNVQRTQRGIMA